ncbi:MAG: NUDIX domain-containing protein [Chitinophagales bacterium]|nr:NUDIX domain-containing protein [Chitinophagales bacterium]
MKEAMQDIYDKEILIIKNDFIEDLLSGNFGDKNEIKKYLKMSQNRIIKNNKIYYSWDNIFLEDSPFIFIFKNNSPNNIYWAIESNGLTHFEYGDKDLKMKKASVAIIENNNKILCIKRSSTGLIGMIGGNREENETGKECVIRECFEECGLAIKECDFVWTGICLGEVDYEVEVYKVNHCEGLIKSSNEGEVGWYTVEDLCNPKISQFYAFNTTLFKFLGKI